MQFMNGECRKFNKKGYDSFILGGDIGGTNTNLGIFGVKKLPVLLLSFNFKSKEINGLAYAVSKVLSYMQKNYKIKIIKACFAIAGVLTQEKDYAKVTNAAWDVSKRRLLQNTKLKKIFMLNDFEAIGYGINMLGKKDIITIKKAKKKLKAPIVVICAGTGLGKTTLIYNECYAMYSPIPSEAGHSDFAAQNKKEIDLIDFIKKYKKIKGSVSYENILSGQGLSNVYMFLRKSKKFKLTKYTKEIDK